MKQTYLMELHPNMVEEVIGMLKYIDVDGETMQFILDKVGMENQMLRQLVMSQPIGEVEYMFEERKQLEEFNKKEPRKIAEKVWLDIYNNDTLIYNTFEEYWLAEFNKENTKL